MAIKFVRSMVMRPVVDPETGEKMLRPVLDEQGQQKMKPVLKDDGSPELDEEGQPLMESVFEEVLAPKSQFTGGKTVMRYPHKVKSVQKGRKKQVVVDEATGQKKAKYVEVDIVTEQLAVKEWTLDKNDLNTIIECSPEEEEYLLKTYPHFVKKVEE